MKYLNQVLLTVIPILSLFLSCSVIRDHPKQVPPGDAGSYEIILKIKNDDQLIHTTRNFFYGFQAYNEWLPTSENDRFQVVSIRYALITPDQLNKLLIGLYDIPGLWVIEIKPVLF